MEIGKSLKNRIFDQTWDAIYDSIWESVYCSVDKTIWNLTFLSTRTSVRMLIYNSTYQFVDVSVRETSLNLMLDSLDNKKNENR